MHMTTFSPLIRSLQGSRISAITDLVAQLKRDGRNLYDFSMGQPDFVTPQYICDAAKAAMDRGDTGYTPTTGTFSLKQAVCEKYQRDNDLHFEPANIAIGSGAKPLITDILRTLAGPGDEIIVAAPCWTCHPGMIRLVGADPMLIRTGEDSGFKMTPASLSAAITDQTRVLVMNAPSNPTGAIYSKEELAALSEVLIEHPGIWLVTDDLYEYIVFDGQKCSSILEVAPDLGERTILINGVSKAFAMTGWRVGYAAGPQAVMDNLNKLMSNGTGCPSSISQAAAEAAIRGPMDFVRKTVAAYEERRNFMVPALNEVPGITCLNPGGAFYLYPGLEGLIGTRTPSGKEIQSSSDFVTYLLENWSVVTVPGAAFELDPHMRISIAASNQELEQGMAQISKAVAALS